VGCGQLIFHKDGKLISIEGDPASAHRGSSIHSGWLTADAASMGAGRARFGREFDGAFGVAGAVGPLKGPISRQAFG
jgi:hypothetical protein